MEPRKGERKVTDKAGVSEGKADPLKLKSQGMKRKLETPTMPLKKRFKALMWAKEMSCTPAAILDHKAVFPDNLSFEVEWITGKRTWEPCSNLVELDRDGDGDHVYTKALISYIESQRRFRPIFYRFVNAGFLFATDPLATQLPTL